VRYRTIGRDPATRRTVSVLGLGAIKFGSAVDEPTSFAILDRYVAAGGTFVDTANNYAFWLTGTRGGESESVLGRWRRSRGVGDEITIATKVGDRPVADGLSLDEVAKPSNVEGLAPAVIRQAALDSMERLGTDRLDLLYAHQEDMAVPQRDVVDAFAGLVADGLVGLLGVSNQWAWRVERARALAAAAGVPGYEVLQYQHSYLRRRSDTPGFRTVDGRPGNAGGDLLSYVRAHPELTLVAYSAVLGGAYARGGRPTDPDLDHAGTPTRLAALHRVAEEVGATAHQVALAWLIGGEVPVIPLVGASSVAQLDESLAAVDLELSPRQRATLDAAH
jgi:aryl-alcohol dehydrogenase-like predicted oxidoreductase